MRKTVLVVVVLLVLGLGYYAYDQNSKKAQAPMVNNQVPGTGENQSGQQDQMAENNTEQPANNLNDASNTANKPETGTSQGVFSDGSEVEVMAPDILVVEIGYDGSKYNPDTVDIKVGDVVIFKNNSSGNFWPASAQHPTHTDYPEFDAKKPIAAGGTYQFKFEKAGNWKFHDHINPAARGTVNVSR